MFALSFSDHLMLTLFDTIVFLLLLPARYTQADVCVASDGITLPRRLLAPGDCDESGGSTENTDQTGECRPLILNM